jgi:heat shock protein HslJ
MAMRLVLIAMAALALAGCAKEVALAKGEMPVIAGSLEGGPWRVEDLNGGGVIDNARLEITFDPGDQGTSRVSGVSGCNRFSGRWQQNGTTITLGPLAGTRMACPPALMEIESKFLATLGAVTMVSYDATGAAFLKAPDGRVIKLRKAG